MVKKNKISSVDIVNIYNDSLEKWSAMRIKGLDNTKFTFNEQWTDAEKKYLRKHGRTPMVYNKLIPRLHNLLGSEQMNRTDILFRAQFSKFNTEAQIIQNIWKTLSVKENVNEKLIKAWFDSLIMPLPSYIEVTLKQDKFGYLNYNFEAISGLDILVDPEYKHYDMSDCRYIIKEKWMTKDEILSKYGNKFKDKFEEKEPSWWQQLGNSITSFIGTTEYQTQFYDKNQGFYKILEYQERIKEENVKVYNSESGEMYEISKKDYQKLKDDPRIRYMLDSSKEKISITVCLPYISEIIYSEISPLSTNMFNIIPVCSFDFNHKKSETISLICLLTDIQKNFNKRQSQYTNILDNAVNSPLIVDQQDEELKREYEQKGNKPGSVFISKASSKVRPYRLQAQGADPNIINDIMNMENQFNDISAITASLRGQSESSEESGRLFQMKAQASSASVNPYFHNLTKTRILLGKYFLETLPDVYGEQNRIVSIIENTMSEPQEVMINLQLTNGSVINDVLNFEGYVIADEGRHSITEQEKQFETKFAIMQSIGDPMLINWEWLLQDSGISDVKKQVDYMNQIMGIRSADAQQQQELQNQTTDIDNVQKIENIVNPKTNNVQK